MVGEVQVYMQLFNTNALEYLLGSVCHIAGVGVGFQFQFDRTDIFFRAQGPKVWLLKNNRSWLACVAVFQQHLIYLNGTDAFKSCELLVALW